LPHGREAGTAEADNLERLEMETTISIIAIVGAAYMGFLFGVQRGMKYLADKLAGPYIVPPPYRTVEVERRVERFVSHVMDPATAAPGELVQIDRQWMLRLGEDLAELLDNNRELKRDSKERMETLSWCEVHGEDAAVDFLVALGYTFTKAHRSVKPIQLADGRTIPPS
jgi:hypothetical protein